MRATSERKNTLLFFEWRDALECVPLGAWWWCVQLLCVDKTYSYDVLVTEASNHNNTVPDTWRSCLWLHTVNSTFVLTVSATDLPFAFAFTFTSAHSQSFASKLLGSGVILLERQYAMRSSLNHITIQKHKDGVIWRRILTRLFTMSVFCSFLSFVGPATQQKNPTFPYI